METMMSKRMCHHVLNQMDIYLSKKPFVRPHWWSRRWIVYMTIQPPLTETYPLWKRSKDELRLLRLFNLSPEELSKKIERYWKKPRWRRWFASFGMSKKIDVWNYYQRCLAYQEIHRNNLRSESNLVTADKRTSILEKLGLVLYQANIKFEAYLEKNCRHFKWNEKFFLEEAERYQLRQRKVFSVKLNKYLKQLASKGEQTILRQQAEEEYQQVEAIMFHYHRLYFNALCRVGPEIKKSNQKKEENTDRRVELYNGSSSVSTFSQSSDRTIDLQNETGSFKDVEKWLQTQRFYLKSLIQKNSPEEVEALLQTSLNVIKNIIELPLGCCENLMLSIEGNYKEYDSFLEYLGSLQNQLKPLLREGLRLFHPDHVINLTHSEKIWSLITHYSQAYIEQSRFYLQRLKNYHLHIEKSCNQYLQKQQALQERAEIKIEILKLKQTLIELSKEWEEDRKKSWDKIQTESERYREEIRAEFELQRARDRAEYEMKRAQDRAEYKQKNAKMEERIEKIMDLLKLQQQGSVSSKLSTPNNFFTSR